jgi:hypothetical protein
MDSHIRKTTREETLPSPSSPESSPTRSQFPRPLAAECVTQSPFCRTLPPECLHQDVFFSRTLVPEYLLHNAGSGATSPVSNLSPIYASEWIRPSQAYQAGRY